MILFTKGPELTVFGQLKIPMMFSINLNLKTFRLLKCLLIVYYITSSSSDFIEAFNSILRYLDDLLNIDNIYFDQMGDRIYPTELQLNRANSSDTEAPFMDLNLCISNGIVSTKIYDKRDDFDLDIVNFPFLDGDVPRRTSYGVYISQLIRFARASSNLSDINLGLDDMSLAWPTMVQLLVFITLTYSRISHEPLFIDFYVFALRH